MRRRALILFALPSSARAIAKSTRFFDWQGETPAFQILICRGLHGGVCAEVFARLFQKAAPIQRAERWAPPQRRTSLILPKRHRRVNAEPRLGRGEDRLRWVCFACEARNHTSGGFPLVPVLRGGGTSHSRSEFPLVFVLRGVLRQGEVSSP